MSEITGRWWTLVAGVWPGLAQILCGPVWAGWAVAQAFSVLLCMAVGSTWLGWNTGSTAQVLLWVTVGVAWALSAVWTVWTVILRDPARFRDHMDGLFRQAQHDQLRGDLQQARGRFEEILKLDPTDSDAMVYLAGIHDRLGQKRQAEGMWRRCRVHDWNDKWQWEAETALARLTESVQTPSAGQ